MTILIKQATIVSPKSEYHNQVKDILIKNGTIEKIGNNIKDDKAKVIKSKNLHASIGWLDIGAHCPDPGFEHRESLETLSHCAASGGYTGIAVLPNSSPVVDNKSSIQYILNSTANYIVDFHPIGALSKKCKGEEISEMMDLSKHGAVAFSDGQNSTNSSGLLLRALEYVRAIDGLIINQPLDRSISGNPDIHEGEVSTRLGLKASPSISEFLMLERDIQLNQYAQSRYLAHQISTKESVDKIESLKNKNTFASVAYLNLCKTEEAIQTFDVNTKVIPPLRAKEDQEALIKGVNKGTIDIICSNHVPLEEELKKKEFVYADNGAIGLQTCYSALNTYANKISVSKIVRALAINPRKILNIEEPIIQESTAANITLFDPDKEWEFNSKLNQSKSSNSPFLNTTFKGSVIGIINGKKSHFNNY